MKRKLRNTFRVYCFSDVMSVISNCHYLSPSGRNGMWQLMNFMIDEYLPEHECHRVARKCQCLLARQFPGLLTPGLVKDIDVLHIRLDDQGDDFSRRVIAEHWFEEQFPHHRLFEEEFSVKGY